LALRADDNPGTLSKECAFLAQFNNRKEQILKKDCQLLKLVLKADEKIAMKTENATLDTLCMLFSRGTIHTTLERVSSGRKKMTLWYCEGKPQASDRSI